MVIYDPHDPHKHLYDVDDGESPKILNVRLPPTDYTESTVISLFEWYHTPAPQLPAPPCVCSIWDMGIASWTVVLMQLMEKVA